MFSVVESLRQQIASQEATLQDLRQQLAEAEHNQQQQEKVLRQKVALSHDPLDHDMNFGIPDHFRSEVFAVLDLVATWVRSDGRLTFMSTSDMEGN
jgi:adenylyltransferase/sulfurtransferase